VGRVKPLTTDSALRLGSFVRDGCATTYCIILKWLGIRLAAAIVIPAIITTSKIIVVVDIYDLCIFIFVISIIF
jgi:hypothetical protein